MNTGFQIVDDPTPLFYAFPIAVGLGILLMMLLAKL